MTQWYDRTGRAITDEQAAEHRSDPSYYVIARHVERGHTVLTRWFGDRGELAELFNTQILGNSEPPWLTQHPTEESALAGHKRAIKVLQEVSVVWGVGHSGAWEHAYPAIPDPCSGPWSLCGWAYSITDPPTERGDLDRCPTRQRVYAKRVDHIKERV